MIAENLNNRLENNSSDLLSKPDSGMVPKYSIIIPVFNQVEYTKQCIEAVWETCKGMNYEIIVIDDCSSDGTDEYLQSLGSRVRAHRNEKNQGFILNCNYAASIANGEYIVLLNNDTIPQENWLEALAEPFSMYENVAATGALMIHPDNKVLEACSIVFSDGSGWNYGRGDNYESTRYNFIREVDYVSGGGMMVPKKIWNELGGLDTYFCPAYYDDIDFCFKARKAGYKVLYTPFSRIIHFEGMTGGTDVTKGVKRYQIINREKFKERWKDELKNQYENKYENVFRASRRGNGKRILWIDHSLPLPNFNSGCLRMNNLMKSIVKLGHKITYVHLSNYDPDNYAGVMRKMGVETVGLNFEAWQLSDNKKKFLIADHVLNALEVFNNNYDIVYLSFYWVAALFIKNIRKRLPESIIYVDSHDIHFLRTKREAELYKDIKHLRIAEQTRIEEIAVYNRADAVMTVTELDRQALLMELPNKPVFLMPNVHDVVPTEKGFDQRKDLLFVGGFNHTPNVDAMIYFCNDIFPKVKEKIPEIKLWIVGSNPSDEVKALANESVIVTGWVKDTKPYLDQSRISIAPLRYGAGMKGKVGEAMSHGLPVITTSVGSEGMGIVNGEHAVVVDDNYDWVEQITNLYYNEELWKKLSQNGQSLMAKLYGSDEMLNRANYILNFRSRKEIAELSPEPEKGKSIYNDLSVTIVIVTYNQEKYTKECIASIKKFTNIPYRLLIVDNYSTDKTRSYLTNLPGAEIVFNNQNVGFPYACNQGIIRSYDEYVLILNNDVVVTEGWLERLVEIAESDKSIGLVGPISNKVSGLQIDKDARYESIEKMHHYAKRIREKNKGQIFAFPRLAFLCTLIKKEVIDKIGGLDERFSPGNYEDDDFCLRAQLAGFKSVIAKDVFIHHYGSKSFKAEGDRKYDEILQINKNKFVEKWGAKPDEIWLKNKQIKPHQVVFPISLNLFEQYFERTRILLADNEISLAFSAIKFAVLYYKEWLTGKFEITYWELLELAGNLALANNELETAQKYFEEGLKENPDSSTACLGLAKVFLALEQTEKAKVMLEWAVKNDVNNNLAYEALEKVNEILGYEINHNSLMVESNG